MLVIVKKKVIVPKDSIWRDSSGEPPYVQFNSDENGQLLYSCGLPDYVKRRTKFRQLYREGKESHREWPNSRKLEKTRASRGIVCLARFAQHSHCEERKRKKGTYLETLGSSAIIVPSSLAKWEKARRVEMMSNAMSSILRNTVVSRLFVAFFFFFMLS